MNTVKYRLVDGNELSVTYDGSSQRIAYVECDWNRNGGSTEVEFHGFKFGTTTLQQLRDANGSNGFSYKSNAMNTAGGELFTFNAYAVNGKPGLVAVFVTVLNIGELRRKRANREPGSDDVAMNLKLDAIILAEETYLDGIWGKEKVYDKDAKPIDWPSENPRAGEARF